MEDGHQQSPVIEEEELPEGYYTQPCKMEVELCS